MLHRGDENNKKYVDNDPWLLILTIRKKNQEEEDTPRLVTLVTLDGMNPLWYIAT